MAGFRVGLLGDRWWLVAGDGRRFLSIGVAHAEPTNLQYPHNIDIWRRKYGSRERWIADGVVRNLTEWGFTTISATEEYVSGSGLGVSGAAIDIGHSPGWCAGDYLAAGMPYCVPLRPLEIESWNRYPAYRDVRSSAFADYCDYLARAICLPHAEQSDLVGYFLVDGPCWERHPTGTGYPSAELYDVAQAYYETVTSAIRRYDPDHLILGDRFGRRAGWPEPVLAALRDHVDVLSVQVFPSAGDVTGVVAELDRCHELTGKPILIADTGNWCATATSPHRASDIPDQAGRAEHYIRTVSAFAERPWCLGWHWCGYVENLARGYGIKDPFDEPYLDFVEPVSRFNHETRAKLGHGEPA